MLKVIDRKMRIAEELLFNVVSKQKYHYYFFQFCFMDPSFQYDMVKKYGIASSAVTDKTPDSSYYSLNEIVNCDPKLIYL